MQSVRIQIRLGLCSLFICLMLISPALAQPLKLLKPYIALNPQGAILAVMKETSISIIDLATGQELNELVGFDRIYPPMTWSYSGLDLAFVHNGDIEVWGNVANSTEALKIQTIKYYESFDMTTPPYLTVEGIQWSIDDTKLGLGVGSTILIWDIQENTLLDQYLSSEWAITFISSTFSWVDDDTFVIGDLRGSVYVFSLSEKVDKKIYSVPVFSSYDPYIQSLAVSHSGDRVVLAEGVGDGSMGRIYAWDFGASTEFYNESSAIYEGHGGEAVYVMAWSPDDQKIASIGSDYTLQIWDVETGQTYRVIQLPQIQLCIPSSGRLMVVKLSMWMRAAHCIGKMYRI